MRVIDELHGLTDFPEYLTPIITSPELQRLRDVRLLNTFSTSLGSLSDVRRLTHTLGVTSLFLRLKPLLLKELKLDNTVCRTIEIACLVHDTATPAFAHLFESELAKSGSWNHEFQIESLIKGNYGPENVYHQIYFHNRLSLPDRIRDLGVDPQQVWLTIRGDAPFGHLLRGTMDLDNIDNVMRMYNSLGLGNHARDGHTIVDSIIPHPTQLVVRTKARSAIEFWAKARKTSYDILVFDEPTLSSQAMLSHLIATALADGYLNSQHWSLTDDQLLHRLSQYPPGKETIKRLAVGNTYPILGLYWYDYNQEIADHMANPSKREELENQLTRELRIPCLIYYFRDQGTFQKRLRVNMGDSFESSEPIDLGEQSDSLVIAILTSSQEAKAQAPRKTVTSLFESMLPTNPSRRNLPLVKSYYGVEHQQELLI